MHAQAVGMVMLLALLAPQRTLATGGPLPSMHRKLTQSNTWATPECTDPPAGTQACTAPNVKACCGTNAICSPESLQGAIAAFGAVVNPGAAAAQPGAAGCLTGDILLCCPPKGK